MSAPLALPWRSVEKGMRVELRGKVWLVDKIKLDGKLARVTVSGVAGTFTRDVKAKDVVTIARPEPLRKRGAQTRWATDTERDLADPSLKPGDASIVKRPAKARGADWSEPQGKTERDLAKRLDATLVAEAVDESEGYYVPPVDVSTILAHWQIFHGGTLDALTELDALSLHADEHTAALSGRPADALAVNHWHEKRRP